MTRRGTSGVLAVSCLFFAVGWTVVAQTPSEGLSERDQQIRALTESLAIARTEVELFRKKWAEARLRAEALGADFRSTDATQLQRKLEESLRSLYLAQAENQQFVQQLERLIASAEKGGDVRTEIERAKEFLASRSAKMTTGLPAEDGQVREGRVLDVNAQLRLVVLNVGAQHGVRVGMPAHVERNGKMIGQVRVIEVRERICGALIENAGSNVTLAAGDIARLPGVGNGF